MARTIGDVVDRILREWLYPPDARPTSLMLVDAISDTDTALTYDEGFLLPEEVDAVGFGTLLEIGTEQTYASAIDTSLNVIDGLIRGARGTTATSHSANTEILIEPAFSRAGVFNALADQAVNLYPDLFTTKSEAITVDSKYNEGPSDLIQPVHFSYLDSGGRPARASVAYSSFFPDSFTGGVVVIDAPSGTEGYITYYARPTRPTAESDKLTNLGLDESWELLLIIGTLAQVISGTDISRSAEYHIASLLDQEQGARTTGSRIRDSLLNYHSLLKFRARSQLLSMHGAAVNRSFPSSTLQHAFGRRQRPIPTD